jgi:glycosyltransferase involved in cell wall biosynthesis
MRVAVLVRDNREHYKDYAATVPYFGTAPEALLQGLAHFPEDEIHVVSCARAKMASVEKLAPNIFFHSLYVPRLGWFRTAHQGCIRAVRRRLRQIQPAIVHGQGTEHDCAISAVYSGFPNLLTIHGNMQLIAKVNRAKPFSFEWLAARLEQFTIPRSDGVVCITRYTQAALAKSARRTWVVPNAVDASFYGLHAQPLPGKPAKILCVGYVCLRKNQNELIRALDPLAGRFKFELLFLGGARAGQPYDDEFLALVQARPWCQHLGLTRRDKLKTHLSESSLLVLPSLEDNCPMVVLEAMAAGVPVVAARVGGVPELIEENTTGILCDPLEPISLRAAVERVLADASLSRQLAQNAKATARERYHPRVIAARHLEIYRDVLSTLA